ncbi:MAG: cytochrome c maturation protein CcmE [Gammaproteobacteria bacterium]
MTPRRQRMLGVALVLTGISIAAVLVLQALEENAMFFRSPTEVRNGTVPQDRPFRLGGLVVAGSFHREPGSLEATFQVTDNNEVVTVSYTGVLPDLFKEGQGMIANGTLQPDGIFLAEEVLAKHDENYMSPEVAKMLAEQGHPGNTPNSAGQTTDN